MKNNRFLGFSLFLFLRCSAGLFWGFFSPLAWGFFVFAEQKIGVD